MRLLILFVFLSPLFLHSILQPHYFFFDDVSRELEPPVWAENEGDHYPCGREWWNIDAFFQSAGTNWSITASFEYELETPACNMFLTLFNLDNETHYSLGSYGDDIGTLLHKKGSVDLRYGASWMQGRYPEYVVHFERDVFTIHMQFKAVTPPKFVADNISSGILPMGLGYYIYGFIPFCTVEGTFSVNGRISALSGKGYYEHVWGNWTYGSPLQNSMDIRKVSSAYVRLASWWLSHRRSFIPSSVALSSENNMFGYDWMWASFTNNWSLFYGNIMFWMTKGPVFGILYLITPEGEYITFCNIRHKYGKMEYVEAYDVYYPSEIFITAREESKKLVLHFSMNNVVHTYLDHNLSSPYWKVIALWESPGIVTGYYSDDEHYVTLEGLCEIEPERQISILGHGRLNLYVPHPYNGLGVEAEITSHLLGVRIELDLYLLPFSKTNIRFYFLKGISRYF